MSFPTIFDLLDQLAFLRGTPSTIIVLVAALIAIIVWDMRLVLPALLVHYLAAGLLYVDILDPRLAFVYTLIGVFISGMMLVTSWQVNWGRPPRGLSAVEAADRGASGSRRFGPLTITDRGVLRFGFAAFVLGVTFWMTRSSDLPLIVVPDGLAYIAPAIVGLAGLGMVGLSTTAEPLKGGVGLLILLTGFSLFYGFLNQSLIMTIALTMAQLTVALATGYLAQAHFLPLDIAGDESGRNN